MADLDPVYEELKQALYDTPLGDEGFTVRDLLRWQEEIERTRPKFIVHGREAGEVVQAMVDKMGLVAEVVINEHVAKGMILLANPAALDALPYDFVMDGMGKHYSMETPEEMMERIRKEWLEDWKDSFAKSTMKITGITT